MKLFFSKGLITGLIFLALSFFFVKDSVIKVLQPKNIIIISSDTLRTDRMGIYGYDKKTTPNIDEWAKKAYVFDNYYTVLPITYPSFTALMTGKQPFATGVTTNRDKIRENTRNLNSGPLNNTIPTLVKILKKEGFETAGYVSNPQINQKLSNLGSGFDVYNAGPFYESRILYSNFIKRAFGWLTAHKNKKIFFWIHLIYPHPPYNPPDDLKCKFSSINCQDILKNNFKDLETNRHKKMGLECPNNQVTDYEKSLYSSLYDGQVAYMDQQFKSILNKINLLGLDKNSLIIFLSDHGEGFDHKYNFIHGEVLYNSSIKVPLIVKFPSNNNGRRIKGLIDNTDLLPTILKLLNLPQDQYKFDGVEQTGLLNWFSVNKKQYSYFISSDAKQFGVTDGRYKYIYYQVSDCLHKQGSEELYDLRNDPKETVNIINKDAKKAEQLRMVSQQYMKRYKVKQKVQFPLRESKPNETILQQLKSLGY